MRTIVAALTAAIAFAAPAHADIERRAAEGTVDEAFERLRGAVEEAGATIFAEVDHGAGAAEAGLDLDASRLLIFGNPQLGTPVMQEDIEAGLLLPLKMLVYRDGDQTYVAYREIDGLFNDDVEVDDDLEVLDRMEQAMQNFAAAAAGQ